MKWTRYKLCEDRRRCQWYLQLVMEKRSLIVRLVLCVVCTAALLQDVSASSSRRKLSAASTNGTRVSESLKFLVVVSVRSYLNQEFCNDAIFVSDNMIVLQMLKRYGFIINFESYNSRQYELKYTLYYR